MTVRTRFAPSPTGYLHIGGARTALYCWLFAKRHQGTFILRIEDTDRERSTDESIQAILDSMQWLNLNYDEGPFYQTQRFDHYRAAAEKLLAEGHAYRCYCSKERLEKLRTEQQARQEKPRYDGHCRNLRSQQTGDYVVRFANPLDGEVIVNDAVHGDVVFQNTELDDLIILRSDGVPTYNFTVVVDDWDMKITHVIRGDDHLNNTPRQINILKALGGEIPVYAHVPMILGPDGKRLSKRHGSASVMEYREQGFLPEAVLNYLVRLGWSHGDQEIFSRDELQRFFDLDHLNKSPASINPEKLLWINQHYLKTSDVNYVAKELAWHFQQLNIDIQQGPALIDIVKVQCERTKTLREMAERSRFLFEDVKQYDEKAAKQHLTADSKSVLQVVCQRLEKLTAWNDASIHQLIQECAEELKLGMGKIAQPIRVAVTGNTVSPSIDQTLRLLGKDKTLKRLQQAIDRNYF